MRALQMQTAMADVRHQRQRGQRFDRTPGAPLRTTPSASLTGSPAHPRGRPPAASRRFGGSDEILAAIEVQRLMPRVHIRRADAAVLGRAQRTQRPGRGGPKRAQRALITGEKGQAPASRPSARRARPAATASAGDALKQAGVPRLQVRRLADVSAGSTTVARACIAPCWVSKGLSHKHHQNFTEVTPALPSLSLPNKIDRPQGKKPAHGDSGMTQMAITAPHTPHVACRPSACRAQLPCVKPRRCAIAYSAPSSLPSSRVPSWAWTWMTTTFTASTSACAT